MFEKRPTLSVMGILNYVQDGEEVNEAYQSIDRPEVFIAKSRLGSQHYVRLFTKEDDEFIPGEILLLGKEAKIKNSIVRAGGFSWVVNEKLRFELILNAEDYLANFVRQGQGGEAIKYAYEHPTSLARFKQETPAPNAWTALSYIIAQSFGGSLIGLWLANGTDPEIMLAMWQDHEGKFCAALARVDDVGSVSWHGGDNDVVKSDMPFIVYEDAGELATSDSYGGNSRYLIMNDENGVYDRAIVLYVKIPAQLA